MIRNEIRFCVNKFCDCLIRDLYRPSATTHDILFSTYTCNNKIDIWKKKIIFIVKTYFPTINPKSSEPVKLHRPYRFSNKYSQLLGTQTCHLMKLLERLVCIGINESILRLCWCRRFCPNSDKFTSRIWLYSLGRVLLDLE